MKLSIVILNWNGKKHLENYLPHVVAFSDPSITTVIVADNGSTDGSVEFLRERFPQVELILLDQNYGFAGGYNKALEKVDADIYCLLNSDVRVTSGWLNPIVELFKSDRSIAAVQPKILSDRDYSRFEHAGAAGGFVDKYGYPFCRGRIMDVIETDSGQYDQQTDIFWASGACLFIRADLFRENHGFDADFFAHMEEIDLCWRLKNQGYRIVFTPESTVYHWGGATLDYNNPHKLFLNFRNSLWTLYKNYTGRNLPFTMFKRMVIDTLAIAKYFVCFDFRNSWTIVKAHLSFHQSKPILKKKRKILMGKVTTTCHHEMLKYSIVWQFFFFSRKKFSDFPHFKKELEEEKH
ncbi:MAG TPA: glycosyltransferase family 2 protein [Prolixibacteraceae bacterium]|nr:glycosyltransferase family 2 protein [Prolixibacteraceae bacterium]